MFAVSKFRNISGTIPTRQNCWSAAQPSDAILDVFDGVAASHDSFAVQWRSASNGDLAIVPLDAPRRLDDGLGLQIVRAGGSISAQQYSPHDDTLLAAVTLSGQLHCWRLADQSAEETVSLKADGALRSLRFHPTASQYSMTPPPPPPPGSHTHARSLASDRTLTRTHKHTPTRSHPRMRTCAHAHASAIAQR